MIDRRALITAAALLTVAWAVHSQRRVYGSDLGLSRPLVGPDTDTSFLRGSELASARGFCDRAAGDGFKA
jgi:hypothetical protein